MIFTGAMLPYSRTLRKHLENIFSPPNLKYLTWRKGEGLLSI